MLGHFTSIEPHDVAGLGWKTTGLYFERAPHPPPKDVEVGKLVERFDTLVEKLHLIARSVDEFFPMFNMVVSVARASVAPDPAFDLMKPIQKADLEAFKRELSRRVAGAHKDLASIERELVRLANKQRTRYFVRMLKWGGAVAAIGYSAFLLVDYLSPNDFIWIRAIAVVLPGAALGTLTAGFSSTRNMAYERIERFDQYDFLPWERYAWVGLLSFVLLALFWFGLVGFSLGKAVDFKEVRHHPEYGFLIGLFCGLGEAAVAEYLAKLVKSQLRLK